MIYIFTAHLFAFAERNADAPNEKDHVTENIDPDETKTYIPIEPKPVAVGCYFISIVIGENEPSNDRMPTAEDNDNEYGCDGILVKYGQI
jgi:hypothetical protein